MSGLAAALQPLITIVLHTGVVAKAATALAAKKAEADAKIAREVRGVMIKWAIGKKGAIRAAREETARVTAAAEALRREAAAAKADAALQAVKEEAQAQGDDALVATIRDAELLFQNSSEIRLQGCLGRGGQGCVLRCPPNAVNPPRLCATSHSDYISMARCFGALTHDCVHACFLSICHQSSAMLLSRCDGDDSVACLTAGALISAEERTWP